MHEDHKELVVGHNVETGKHSVKKGTEVDARGKSGKPSFVSKAGHVEIAKHPIKKFGEPSFLTKAGFHGYVETTVKKGVWDDFRTTELHSAARAGNVDFVERLVEQGAQLNAEQFGETALHAAAWTGHVDVVKCLVENGADVNATDKRGETALHMAAEEGHVDVVKYLVENGAEVNATRKFGDTALHKALRGRGRVDVVKYLVENGADVNATDKWGRTALYKAAREGHVDVVKYLVENGAEVNATDMWNKAALHVAAEQGYVYVVKYLFENGADVNATDKSEQTALHFAAKKGRVDVVKCLVEKGAQLDAKDEEGKIPLDLATAKGHDLVIKYLVDERAKLDAIKEARSLALQFMSENPGCIRAVPYESSNEDTKPLTIRLYVDDDETGITDEFKDAAQKKFGDLYEIEYEDLLRPPLSNIIKPCKKHKEEELSSLSKIIEKHLHLFDNRLNVTAVCASYKVTDFIEKDTPCVTVFVLGKGRIPAGEKDIDQIKRRCGSMFANTEFDVAEGYYRPANGPSPESRYTLPLRGGVGIGVQGRPAAGTLGGFLEDEEGKLYILSNEHVLNPRVGVSEIENPTGNIIEQPAQSDYAKILKKATVKHRNWSSKRSTIEKSKQDADNPDNYVHFDERYVKRVERHVREAENELDKIESEKPRRIGEYVCGLQDNVEGHFVDAAIAVLDENESLYMLNDKHSEDKTDLCPLYGFENDEHFRPNGEIVKKADIFSGVTQGREFMKIGKKTSFTKEGSVDTTSEKLFVKGYSTVPKHVEPFKPVQCAFCESCIHSISGDTEKCHDKAECGSCGKRLDHKSKDEDKIVRDPVWCFWALNCLVIRQPFTPFSDTGDSGAILFGNDGRAWGLVFATFRKHNECMCVASPLGIALKALEDKSGKKFKLWCTKEKGKDSGEEEKSEDEEEKRKNEESEQIEVDAENGTSKEVIEENEEIEETGVSEEKEETQLEHINKLKRVNDNLKTMDIGE